MAGLAALRVLYKRFRRTLHEAEFLGLVKAGDLVSVERLAELEDILESGREWWKVTFLAAMAELFRRG